MSGGQDGAASSNLLLTLLGRQRLILGVVLLASVTGATLWFLMPREEDPKIAERFGLVIAPYPGADARDLERLVVLPIEEALAEQAEIDEVRVTIRPGVAIMIVNLRETVRAAETDDVWNEVERRLDAVALPEGSLAPSLDHEQVDTQSVLLAVGGGEDLRETARQAADLRERVLGLDEVVRVVTTGDPGEVVTIDVDDDTVRRLGIDLLSLRQSLLARNSSIPGGSVQLGDRGVSVRSSSDLRSLAELASLPVPIAPNEYGVSQRAIALGEVADIRLGYEEPLVSRARFDGASSVFLGVVPRAGERAEEFGERVQEVARRFVTERAARHPELRVDVVTYQPARVEARLAELGGSLVLGVAIVLAVVLLLMGIRMGLVVASIVPLVVFAAVAVYASTGGVLHQIAVAALVIALGLLVDNAIVVAESIQRMIDEGMAPMDAARQTVMELALPLGSATGTTLASFVPMLLADGNTGDFTRAIPVVVMITLTMSYGYALLVTPLVASFGLRPTTQRGESRLDAFAAEVGAFGAHNPWTTLLLTTLIIAASASFATRVRIDFFPKSDRDQVLVEVTLPEGTHLSTTDATSRRLERWLAQRDEVEHLASFVGQGAPRFYYNLPLRPRSPHLAQILVDTRSPADVNPLRHAIQEFARASEPGAVVIARRLEQGPPVNAPVEVRLFGEDLADLAEASRLVRRELQDIDSTRFVRDDQGSGIPVLRYATDDFAAARQGVDRERVALTLLAHTRGLPTGSFRGGDDAVPIVLRSRVARSAARADQQGPAELEGGDLPRPGTTPLPLAEVATRDLRWEPAVIHRYNRRRVVSAFAEHTDDVTYQDVVSALAPRVEALSLPPGVEWQMAGAWGESNKANGALGTKAIWGALLLVFFLLAEFNSVRRTLIVLGTAPLAALGVWPGLYLGNLPFGFVALLGAIALIGIAVNGAIVLIDVADRRREEGASVADALTDAVRLRTRPILLTTATTVAGLTPLLFSESTLWPPLAAAMISGLLIATFLTLGVVPAAYRLLFPERRRPSRPAVATGALALLGLALAVAPEAHAQDRTGEVNALMAEDPSNIGEVNAFMGVDPLSAALEGEGPELDLASAVAQARARAPELAVAEAQIEAARAGVREARAALFPRLEVSARYTRIGPVDNDPLIDANAFDTTSAQALIPGVDDPEAQALFTGLFESTGALANARIEVPENQYAFRADLSYPVSAIFLQVLPAQRAAQHAVEVEEARRAASELVLVRQVRELYLEHLRARSLLAQAEDTERRVRDQLRRVQVAQARGAATVVELRRVEAGVAAAAIGVRQARAGVDTSAAALATLCGLDRESFRPAAVFATLPPTPSRSLAELVAQGRDERPEVRALEALAQVRESQGRAALGSRLPVLALAAGVEYSNPNQRFVPLRDRFDTSWDVSVVARWSPNDTATGGVAQARAAAERALAEAELERLRDGVRIEVTQAYHALFAALAAHEHAEAGVRAAEAGARAARQRLEVGRGTAGDVIDADNELTGARVQRIDAAIEAHLAHARLQYALGVPAE